MYYALKYPYCIKIDLAYSFDVGNKLFNRLIKYQPSTTNAACMRVAIDLSENDPQVFDLFNRLFNKLVANAELFDIDPTKLNWVLSDKQAKVLVIKAFAKYVLSLFYSFDESCKPYNTTWFLRDCIFGDEKPRRIDRAYEHHCIRFTSQLKRIVTKAYKDKCGV